MSFKDDFFKYVSKNFKDIAFEDRADTLFPDIETGYSSVKIVYNKAYHSLDMRFSGMGDYEAIFGTYVYPVLMQYRDYSVWKMGNARVIRVKVPCVNEELGFIEEDCSEQLEKVRQLMEILSRIDVAGMYQMQKKARGSSVLDEVAIMAEAEDFVQVYNQMLDKRTKEKTIYGMDSYGKKGLLYRLTCMSKDLNAFLMGYSEFITKNRDSVCVKLLLKYKDATDRLIKEVL